MPLQTSSACLQRKQGISLPEGASHGLGDSNRVAQTAVAHNTVRAGGRVTPFADHQPIFNSTGSVR